MSNTKFFIGLALVSLSVAFVANAKDNKAEAKCGNGTAKCPPTDLLQVPAVEQPASAPRVIYVRDQLGSASVDANGTVTITGPFVNDDVVSKCDVKPSAKPAEKPALKFGCGKK